MGGAEAIKIRTSMTRIGISMMLLLLLAVGAAAQELPFLSTDSPVGPRDVLDVKVIEDPQISGRAVVGEDGNVALNVLGKVLVAGLSASQIEARLQSLLEANYLARATVAVQVVEFASKPISVVGAVVRPGRITATGTTTLIQAITQAGGLTAAAGKELYVLRTGRSGLSEQVAISIEDLMVNGNPDANIPLAPNDLVNIPPDAPITIYLLGEVMKPGKAQFRSSQTPTLLQAIADAGGPTDRASRNVIIKRMNNGQQLTIRVNYRDILRGKRADEVLRDNDTVYLAEAIF